MPPLIESKQHVPLVVEGLVPTSGPLIVGQDNPNYVSEYWHRYQQVRRWRLLTGHGELDDPLHDGPANRFHISGTELLELARRKPPRFREPTVSAFADWIYSLYTPEPAKMDLEGGRLAEARIQIARFDRKKRINSMSDMTLSDWTLVHNGMSPVSTSSALHTSRGPSYFEIPTLRIGSQPLRASPDLLYLHRETRDAVLVEIKFSNKEIPSNLWPNVWAQLWAYAHIPQLQDSPTIRAAGEVWGEIISIRNSPPVCLRRVVVHNPRDASFDSFFRELFNIYSRASNNRSS